MSNALLAAGPLIKAGCYIVLDTPQAKAIDKKTGKVILTADFEPQSATWNVYPSRSKPKHQGPVQHLANNAYRIETKKRTDRILSQSRWTPGKENVDSSN